MYATRIPAISRSKVPLNPTLTPEELNARLPMQVRWKADNYRNLMEQPTQFYAVALTAAMVGAATQTDVRLAWVYVGLRVVHSFAHNVGNWIPVRFWIFASSSAVLLVMTVRVAAALMQEW